MVAREIIIQCRLVKNGTRPRFRVDDRKDFRGCFAARIFADFLNIRVDPRCEASAKIRVLLWKPKNVPFSIAV